MTPKHTGLLFKLTAFVVAACAAALVFNAVRLSFLSKESYAETRSARILELTAKRNQLDSDLAKVRAQLAAIPAQIVAEEERLRQADKVIAQLKALESTWDRLVGNPAQQKANAEQIVRMQTIRTEATTKIGTLRDETKRTTWEKDGLDIERTKVAGQLAATERRSWALTHYLGLGWQGVRRWVVPALLLNGAGLLFFVWWHRRTIFDR